MTTHNQPTDISQSTPTTRSALEAYFKRSNVPSYIRILHDDCDDNHLSRKYISLYTEKASRKFQAFNQHKPLRSSETLAILDTNSPQRHRSARRVSRSPSDLTDESRQEENETPSDRQDDETSSVLKPMVVDTGRLHRLCIYELFCLSPGDSMILYINSTSRFYERLLCFANPAPATYHYSFDFVNERDPFECFCVEANLVSLPEEVDFDLLCYEEQVCKEILVDKTRDCFVTVSIKNVAGFFKLDLIDLVAGAGKKKNRLMLFAPNPHRGIKGFYSLFEAAGTSSQNILCKALLTEFEGDPTTIMLVISAYHEHEKKRLKKLIREFTSGVQT